MVRRPCALVFIFALLMRPAATAQQPDARDEFLALESRLVEARARQVHLLAPAAFTQAANYYSEVEAARRKGATPQQLSAGIARTLRALEQATVAAGKASQHLARTLNLRQQVARLNETRLKRADEVLRQAAARYEAGDAAEAEKLARSAELEYSRTAAAFFRETRLKEAAAGLEWARSEAAPEFVQRAEAEFRSTAALLDTNAVFDIGVVESRIAALLELLFPPFYRNPPYTLTIDGFTIYVEAYTSLQWDFRNGRLIHANGTGWISFDCRPKIFQLYPGIATTPKILRVVETVREPLKEISLADARRIDPQLSRDSTVELSLPTYATTAVQVSQAVTDFIHVRRLHQGDIKVHFDDLTIQPGGQPGTGIVLAGIASYPTKPPEPGPLSLPIAGFRVEVSQLVISVKGAVASGFLEFPKSIIDPASGHPGRVPLANFPITKACEFHQQLATAFGPWAIGNTEMVIQGKGVVADFDKSWAPPGVDPSSPAAQAAWRGAILGSGDTIPAAAPVVSNSGYLRAAYHFNNAEVTGPGLRGRFDLTAAFEFQALQPVGYRVQFSGGMLELQDSTLRQGTLLKGEVTAPVEAAQSGPGAPVRSRFNSLFVDDGLHLVGDTTVDRPIRWGEYTQTTGRPTFYEARTFTRPRFYLSGTNRSNYFPIGPTGDFVQPLAPLGDPRIDGMQGLTVYLPRELTIFTSDTPRRKQLDFRILDDTTQDPNWLNISFGGVHARLNRFITTQASNKELGPTHEPFYVGVEPFRPATTTSATGAGQIVSDYRLNISFVSSAVYDSDMNGKFHIPLPADSDLEFAETGFTSTAQISGAKAPFNNPFKLSYWGLDMVKKPGASAGAVISVRTGQVFFTAAGIREQRHFAQPFYLIWGEMLANGALKRLVFDYAGVGQKFDGFPLTTSFMRLSDYDPAKPAFLKVAGTVHFDLFGPKYINVNDNYDPARPGDPYNSRRIDDLMTDSDPAGAFQASDLQLAANWSSGFGSMNFKYNYDKNAQDGFLGTGQMGFLWINGTMASSIVIKPNRLCMSVNENNRRDFTLGPVAHFGAMSRTTGCGCVENGQLQRVMLSAELEAAADANVVLRSASYGRVEWSLTPSVSTLEIAADMYLTILLGANVQVTGLASFTVNREKDFVEGLINGKFSSATALGLNSVSADGQLNWHLGTFSGDGYQSLQGRLAVQVVAPMGGAGVEGGFYIGINAPKSEAWALAGARDRFKLNMTPLPARLTGMYGYVKANKSINLWIFGGGLEAYAGLGAFVLTPAQVVDLNAVGSGLPALPFVIGHTGIHIWGEILGGLVSAGGTVDLQVIGPYPFSFEGTLGLEGCVLWVICGSVDVSVGLNSSEGFYVR